MGLEPTSAAQLLAAMSATPLLAPIFARTNHHFRYISSTFFAFQKGLLGTRKGQNCLSIVNPSNGFSLGSKKLKGLSTDLGFEKRKNQKLWELEPLFISVANLCENRSTSPKQIGGRVPTNVGISECVQVMSRACREGAICYQWTRDSFPCPPTRTETDKTVS